MSNNQFNFNNTYLTDISWITLNKSGLIEDPNLILNNKAAIYIYQLKKDNSLIYIGSTSNINMRIKQHSYCVNNRYIRCPEFYICVEKHGWNNFRLGILEYVNIPEINKDKREIKRIILNREQYYLDILNPSLNKNKAVGSTLGYKHT